MEEKSNELAKYEKLNTLTKAMVEVLSQIEDDEAIQLE